MIHELFPDSFKNDESLNVDEYLIENNEVLPYQKRYKGSVIVKIYLFDVILKLESWFIRDQIGIRTIKRLKFFFAGRYINI
jgi:hypothetical protein